MKGKGIDEFVGEMNTLEEGEVGDVFDPVDNRLKCLQGPLLFSAKVANGSTIQYSALSEYLFIQGGEDIQRQLPIIGALLNETKSRRPAQTKPHFPKLPRQNLPKNGTHTNIGKIIPPLADLSGPRRVISDDRIVKRQFHKAGKGQWTICRDLV